MTKFGRKVLQRLPFLAVPWPRLPLLGSVPCVEDRKVYIVCLDMPKDLKLDLEDGDGNSFSYTEASEYHFETV